MKGLIIDMPWIELILSGQKTWEMRKTACHIRGRIGLIRKGSGQVVGTADLVDCLDPLALSEAYAAAEPNHRIPPDRQGRAFADGWRTPWVLAKAKPLLIPVSYRHPSGAVIWVTLDEPTAAAVQAQEHSATSTVGPPSNQAAEPECAPTAQGRPVDGKTTSASQPATTIRVQVTGGNLRHGHLYLPLDFFPADAIGGSNRTSAAGRTITVAFTPGGTIETDVDGTKRILRERGAVRDFYTRTDMHENDTVLVTRTGPYAYAFTKAG